MATSFPEVLVATLEAEEKLNVIDNPKALAVALTTIGHTWCLEHGCDTVEFFDLCYTMARDVKYNTDLN